MSKQRWRISFEIWGESFFPSRVPFGFTASHDPGSIGTCGRYRGVPTPYGSAHYEVPATIDRKMAFMHLVDEFEPLLQVLKENGAERWNVSIGRYYFSQCNEEYSLEELVLISRLQCGFAYSAYMITEQEELELDS